MSNADTRNALIEINSSNIQEHSSPNLDVVTLLTQKRQLKFASHSNGHLPSSYSDPYAHAKHASLTYNYLVIAVKNSTSLKLIRCHQVPQNPNKYTA